MTPRAYQSRAIDGCRSKFRDGAKRVLLVSPTGSGKTLMLALIAIAHLARSPLNRVVWLAHRVELLEQAAKTLRAFGLEVSVRGSNPLARVQVESIQTILARGQAPEGSLLVPDEAHHFADANACGQIVSLYPSVLGATATPERGDGKPLKPPFDQLVLAAQISELTASGYLVPLRVRCPPNVIGAKSMAQRPVDAYLSETRGERAICFAGNLTIARAYVDDFAGLGVRTKLVHGKMGNDEREMVLSQHKAGDLDVLVNCGVLTEGYDDPAVSCVIVARGCGSQGLWLQMTGRGLRPSTGKTRCTLIDLRGMVHELGRPDADREFSLEGRPIAVRDGQRAEWLRLCRSCKTPLGDLTTCPQCGEQGQPLPKYRNIALVDYDAIKREVKEQVGLGKQELVLAGMMRHPTRSPQQSLAIFRNIFKRHPTDQMMRRAAEYNRLLGVETARREEEAHVERQRTG